MRQKLFLHIITILSCIYLQSSPTYRRYLSTKQPDGSLIEVQHVGNERFSYFVTLDGVPVCQQNGCWYYAKLGEDSVLHNTKTLAHTEKQRNATEKLLANGIKAELVTLLETKNPTASIVLGEQSTAPVSAVGSPIIPVLLVEFSDEKFSKECTPDFFTKHFNQNNFNYNGAYGSVRDYFTDQSDSLFVPNFKIIGPITLHENKAYYGAPIGQRADRNDMVMVQDAIKLAIESGYNLDEFANKQNIIDAIAVIYAGDGEQVSGNENSIWAASYINFNFTYKNIKYSSCLFTNEIANYGKGNFPDGIGTFCHEFSHLLGLPDLYATNGLINNFGLDFWDIMDWGQFIESGKRPVGYSAYERIFMGWLNPIVLSSATANVTLYPLVERNGNRAYKIENNQSSNEYLILENRTDSKWFSNWYGEGMLVYHIDYDYVAWSNNTVNTIREHQRVSIIPADNKATINGEMEDYHGDLYPGIRNNNRLTDNSIPAMKAFKGDFFSKPVEDIQRKTDGLIEFNFMGAKPSTIRKYQQEEIVEVYSLGGLFMGKFPLNKIPLVGTYIIKSANLSRKINLKKY